jgi:hypothetical protein
MYHTRFENLHDDAVEHVRRASSPLWNSDDRDEQLRLLGGLAADLAGVYGLTVPEVRWDSREVYYPAGLVSERPVIGLPRASVVSLLHEFRHHMQRAGRQANPDAEEDARGWSISMFAEARPRAFDKAWRGGRVWFMPEHPGGADA